MNWPIERLYQADSGTASASPASPSESSRPCSVPRSASPRNSSTVCGRTWGRAKYAVPRAISGNAHRRATKPKVANRRVIQPTMKIGTRKIRQIVILLAVVTGANCWEKPPLRQIPKCQSTE